MYISPLYNFMVILYKGGAIAMIKDILAVIKIIVIVAVLLIISVVVNGAY